MEKQFNAQELLEIAIQIEVNGSGYYTKMAEKAQSPDVKAIFQQLSRAEKQHVADFKKVRDSMSDDGIEIPDEYMTEDIIQYLRAFSDGKIFPNWRDAAEVVKEIHSDHDALMHAISFEKDSIIFFHEIFDILPEGSPDRKAVGELIRQEKVHIARLFAVINALPKK